MPRLSLQGQLSFSVETGNADELSDIKGQRQEYEQRLDLPAQLRIIKCFSTRA